MNITNLNLYLTIPETGNPILSTQQPEMSSGTTMEFNITGTFILKNESKSSVRCGIAVFCETQYLFDIHSSTSLASNGTSSETYDNGSNKFSESASVTDGDILIIGYKWDSTNGYVLSDYEYLVGTLSQTLTGNDLNGGQYEYSFSEQGKVTTVGSSKTEMTSNMPAVS